MLYFIRIVLPVFILMFGCNLMASELDFNNAVQDGDIKAVKEGVEHGYSPNLVYSRTPVLWQAASRAQYEVLKYLLEKGGNSNIMAEKVGETPLHAVLDYPGNKDISGIVEVLIQHKADVNLKRAKGEMPLKMAFKRNKSKTFEKVIVMLIDAGADYTVDGIGDNIIMNSCYQGYSDIVKAMKKRGYNFKTKDAEENLIVASEKGNEEIVKVLLEAGVNPAAEKNGKSAIIKAIDSQKAPVVQVLLKAGVKANSKDKRGQTLLYKACGYKDPEVVKALIEAGADVNSVNDSDGYTPLIEAVSHKNTEMVAMLLKAGAKKMIKAKTGDTALDLAKRNGPGEIENMLK